MASTDQRNDTPRITLTLIPRNASDDDLAACIASLLSGAGEIAALPRSKHAGATRKSSAEMSTARALGGEPATRRATSLGIHMPAR